MSEQTNYGEYTGPRIHFMYRVDFDNKGTLVTLYFESVEMSMDMQAYVGDERNAGELPYEHYLEKIFLDWEVLDDDDTWHVAQEALVCYEKNEPDMWLDYVMDLQARLQGI